MTIKLAHPLLLNSHSIHCIPHTIFPHDKNIGPIWHFIHLAIFSISFKLAQHIYEIRIFKRTLWQSIFLAGSDTIAASNWGFRSDSRNWIFGLWGRLSLQSGFGLILVNVILQVLKFDSRDNIVIIVAISRYLWWHWGIEKIIRRLFYYHIYNIDANVLFLVIQHIYLSLPSFDFSGHIF